MNKQQKTVLILAIILLSVIATFFSYAIQERDRRNQANEAEMRRALKIFKIHQQMYMNQEKQN